MFLENLFKILILILTLYVVQCDNLISINNVQNIDDIIIDDVENRKYDGYIYIPKFDYKGLIKKGDSTEVLNSNNILLVDNNSNIKDEVGNIVLAGHNSKNVFSVLYRLNLEDTILISDFNEEYRFIIYEIKIVNIKDTYILDKTYNKKILTLITCTKDNQKRLIVRGKIEVT